METAIEAREIGRTGSKNTAEALAEHTGGRVLSFLRQRGLEQAVARIGEELHSQYLITFKPGGEGYHRIAVQVKGRPELTARTRPGYWIEAPR